MTQVRSGTATGSAGAGDQAKEKAQEAAGQAREKAQQASDRAKSRVAVEVDNRSTQAGERLRSTAGDARSVADELRKQGKDRPAQLADRAAEQTERLGGYLRDSDGQQILRDVEDFGRSKPWALAAGGLVLGFAASRLLKASSTRRYESAYTDGAGSLPERTGERSRPLLAGTGTASDAPPPPTSAGAA
jgi:hypothetical protein